MMHYAQFIRITAVVTALVCASMAHAGNDNDDPASSQLQTAFDTWNSTYSANVLMLGWYEDAPITDDEELGAVIAQLTDPNSVYVTGGNPDDPTSIVEVPLSQGTPKDLDAWNQVINDVAAVGQRRFVIHWLSITTGEMFTSVTLADSDGIVFDSMLATIAPSASIETASGGRNIYWIWGGTRGEIRWSVTCSPDGDGGILCDHECTAWMSLGDAQIKCSVTKQGNCCILNYGYAWRTPTGSIRIVWNPESGEFEIEVTGLGSSGKGNGSVSDCCDGDDVVPKKDDAEPIGNH